jgi:Family of unknown function (DUF5956)
MESADWDVDGDPLWFSRSGDGRVVPTESDDPLDLPAVRAAIKHGYEAAPEAPIWTFLPAVWPTAERTWIPDTRVRHVQVACAGERTRVVPWSTADYFEMESEANGILADCGLPSRPAGRLWLLKPPPGQPSLEHTLKALLASAERAGLQVVSTAEFVEHVRRELRAMFLEQSPGTTRP